jgi:hypothetical protein
MRRRPAPASDLNGLLQPHWMALLDDLANGRWPSAAVPA